MSQSCNLSSLWLDFDFLLPRFELTPDWDLGGLHRFLEGMLVACNTRWTEFYKEKYTIGYHSTSFTYNNRTGCPIEFYHQDFLPSRPNAHRPHRHHICPSIHHQNQWGIGHPGDTCTLTSCIFSSRITDLTGKPKYWRSNWVIICIWIWDYNCGGLTIKDNWGIWWWTVAVRWWHDQGFYLQKLCQTKNVDKVQFWCCFGRF